MADTPFLISREDWSLHRQGQMDQERHQARIREAIRANLAEIVSDEAIIASDGRKVVRLPIRVLKEYRFRLDWQKQERVGEAAGDVRPGDAVGAAGAAGRAGGKGAGEEAGDEWFETDVPLEELEELLFAELSLPHLEPKQDPLLTTRYLDWRDVRRHGITANIDKKRTLLEAMKRNRLAGRPPLAGIRREDLRFRTWDEAETPQASAVLIIIMDTSGSMGTGEKHIARSLCYWMVRFLRTRYEQVRLHFVAHTTEARELDEEAFFTRGESGGTRCSSAYEYALQLIERQYPPDRHNLYAFHFSDGDNLISDNPRAVALLRKLLERCALVGYGQIEIQPQQLGMPYYQPNTLLSLYRQEIDHPRFVTAMIRERSDIYAALRAFFPPASAGEGRADRHGA
ncbi:MAG: sporulation protein YhbH [Symbiobacteriaceae bacterium]